MLEKLAGLIKEAMKARDKERLNALRYLKSMLMENNTSTKPVAEQDVIIRHYKKLNDSLAMYKDSPDKVSDIETEMKVISEFMPTQLDEAAVVAIILEIKASLDSPNMGMIMKELSPKIKGQFDGKKASQLVKENI
ncbi:GatB/YqeY domain-containing protein [Bacteriovoracaceae bacterium]|nr:GatB/YqeY domain-containing protein [Bacteriovoracaceae bacterium]